MKHLVIILCLCVVECHTQNIVCRINPQDNSEINIKWYLPGLISKEGIHVFRRAEDETAWMKLSGTPVYFRAYKITDNDVKRDPELGSYLKMLGGNSQLKDLALLATIIKSFKSETLSRYLGILFDDNYAKEQGKAYYYKIAYEKRPGKELAVSSGITYGSSEKTNAPEKIVIRPGRKKASFTWVPEPLRYYGVNIYRREKDSADFRKLNPEPLIPTKTKNKEGKEDYPDDLFVDAALEEKTTYLYYLEAVDFFGDHSEASETFEVRIKDLDPPAPVDSIYGIQEERKMTLNWRKRKTEYDFVGYNIYRTTKNDSDYTKINKEILKSTSYADHPPGFGQYFFMISCLDQDGNESFSSPKLVELADVEAPLKPQNLQIKSDTGKLILTWNKNTEPDLRGYHVYRTVNKNNDDTYVKLTPLPIKENTFTDSLPKNAKNLFLYKIVAVDESLNKSPYSEPAGGRMPDVTAPSAPFVLKANAAATNKVTIEWLSNAEPDLAGYELYRVAKHDSTNVKRLNKKLLPANFVQYNDASVESGTDYQYYLLARDSVGNVSVPSNKMVYAAQKKTDQQISFITFSGKFSKKFRRVELHWKVRPKEEIKGFVVYMFDRGTTVFTPISGLIKEVAFKYPAGKENNIYKLQVRAYTKRGDVYRSEVIEVRGR